ncbi:hypothetical protein EAH87_05875 [Sphingomonas koreensis]|nr:hypothetical protein EAH87_05875 [Sphingomonas koreensis]
MTAIPAPIVHIGFHKTATSWLQKAFFPHATSHRYLVDRRIVRETLLGGTAFDFDSAAAREKLGFDDGGPPPLICEEDLSGTLHVGLAAGHVAKAVAERIHQTAPEAQIVMFVRAQPSAALSWYIQYLREGGTASHKRYLFGSTYRHVGWSRPLMTPRFDFSQLDYRGLIETYDALFGRENVHVFAYEAFVRDPDAVLTAMRERLGLVIADRPIDARRANDSYRRALLPIVRIANLFSARSVFDKRALVHLPYWYAARKFLLQHVNRLPLGPRPRAGRFFDQQTLDWIGQRFWKNNRWLAERMGQDLGALGYPIDPPAASVEPPAPAAWRRWLKN